MAHFYLANRDGIFAKLMFLQWSIIAVAFLPFIIWTCSGSAILDIHCNIRLAIEESKRSVPLEFLDALYNAMTRESFNPADIPDIIPQSNVEPQNKNKLFPVLPASEILMIQSATQNLLLQLESLRAIIPADVFKKKIHIPSMVVIQRCRNPLNQIHRVQQCAIFAYNRMGRRAFNEFYQINRKNFWVLINKFIKEHQKSSLRNNLLQKDFQLYQRDLRRYLYMILDAIREFE